MTASQSTGPVRLSREAVRPLRTLDPAAPLDDLDWLDPAIGAARVVAIGESAHYNREFLQLRHRLLRYLVERHGFTAHAMETGFVEGWLVDDWVRARTDDGSGDDGDRLGHIMANGLTSLMGLWTPIRTELEWMRRHNRGAADAVGFYGIDLSGSNASLLPGLDAALGYLAQADPEFRADPGIRGTAAAFAATSPFAIPAASAGYGQLAPERRDALTAGLADLIARMTAGRLDYLQRSTAEDYARALRSLHLTATIDALARALVRGDQHAAMINREAAIADTVEWIVGREDRVVLAAHNAHVQRWPGTLPGMPAATTMGLQLADRLGTDYLVIGTTTETGQTLNTSPDFYSGTLFMPQDPPEQGSLDALMAASHDGPFGTDLRRLSEADTATMRAVRRQRFGNDYGEVSPLDAFDVVVHVPHVTPAEPDHAALADSPSEVQEVFSRWQVTA